MSTSMRAIQALRNFITILAEFIFETEKGFLEGDAHSIGTGVTGIQEMAGDAQLTREISLDDWNALIEAALPEIQQLIDSDDEFPDMEARELVDGLSDSDQYDVDDRLIRHRINQAATQLRVLMYEGVYITPSNVVDRLKRHSNIGSGPYDRYWNDFVREHSDEIMLELITNLKTEVERVKEMLESKDNSTGPDREEAEKERLRNLFTAEIDELDLSVGSYDLIKTANIQTVGELVQFEAEEILKYRNCDRENIKELSQVLDEHGLEFGMDVDELLEDE